MNSIVLPKGLNLDLIKSLDPAANLQEMQRKEEYAELLHEYAIAKSTLGNSTSGTAQRSSKNQLSGKERDGRRVPRLSR